MTFIDWLNSPAFSSFGAPRSFAAEAGGAASGTRLAVRVTDRLVEARCRFTAPATATADPGRVLA